MRFLIFQKLLNIKIKVLILKFCVLKLLKMKIKRYLWMKLLDKKSNLLKLKKQNFQMKKKVQIKLMNY